VLVLADFIASRSFPVLAQIMYIDLVDAIAVKYHTVLELFVKALLPLLAGKIAACVGGEESGCDVMAFSKQAFDRVSKVFQREFISRFVLAMAEQGI
jgi:hypothetical protein